MGRTRVYWDQAEGSGHFLGLELYQPRTGKEPQTFQIRSPYSLRPGLRLRSIEKLKNAPTHAIAVEVRRSEWHEKRQEMAEMIAEPVPSVSHHKG